MQRRGGWERGAQTHIGGYIGVIKGDTRSLDYIGPKS